MFPNHDTSAFRLSRVYASFCDALFVGMLLKPEPRMRLAGTSGNVACERPAAKLMRGSLEMPCWV
jgi:hypothetical protein